MLYDKLESVKRYLARYAYKRLIFSHKIHLNNGVYLIDNRDKIGADWLTGELILFEVKVSSRILEV